MATGGRTDPLVSYHFHVEIDGITQAQFKECSGLGSSSDVVEYKESVKGATVYRKQPGALKWNDITLKRGISDVMELWAWRKQIEQGKIAEARKNGSIVLYDQADKEIARWNFKDGWPSKLSGPSVKADTSDVAIEELTITHEGMERVT
jgi:phage tail-like protein